MSEKLIVAVDAVNCSNCGDTLYGRCAEDSRECHCGRTKLKGGPINPVVLVENIELLCPTFDHIEIRNADADVLKYDWDLKLDQFGVLTEHTHNLVAGKQYSVNQLIEL
jgi:hypothetical protein